MIKMMMSTNHCIGTSVCRSFCHSDQSHEAPAAVAGARDGGHGICLRSRRGKKGSAHVEVIRVRRCSNVCAGAISLTQSATTTRAAAENERKRCLRCGQMYAKDENSPTSCSYHGHMTGDLGMFSLAPPHQGIDGEKTEDSGIVVYRWNDEKNRPDTGQKNWKMRWTCWGLRGTCTTLQERTPCFVR